MLTMADVWQEFTPAERRAIVRCFQSHDNPIHMGTLALYKVSTVEDILGATDKDDDYGLRKGRGMNFYKFVQGMLYDYDTWIYSDEWDDLEMEEIKTKCHK